MSRAHRAHQIANFSAAQDEHPLQSGPPAEAQSEPELRRREVLYYYWPPAEAQSEPELRRREVLYYY